MDQYWQTLWLTCKLALVTTVLLALAGIPLAYWLGHTRSRLKPLAETIVSMPLVLPPSVIGFYLLIAFSPQFAAGRMLESVLSFRLAFSFEGLVVASCLYGLPFMVRPIQAGFESLPGSLREAAATLGKTRLQTLVHVLLPNIRSSVFSALVLTFAHAIGEFGIVLMIGGNIPGETRTASIAIYDQLEALQYESANLYSLTLVALSFAILIALHFLNRNGNRARSILP